VPAPAPTPDSADAATIDRYLAGQLREQGLVGLSVAVVRDGEVVLAKGYGLQSTRSGAPVAPETMFAIGSVTKQFTAACALLLAQDGKLSLTDPVARWLPDLPRSADVTLLDLMHHTSGYRDYYPLDFVDARMRSPVAPEELARRYAGDPLDFEPGTRWSYSNTGFIVLGLVVERVSGEPFEAFLTRRILEPLGMRHTRLEPEPGSSGLADGHLSFALSPPTPTAPEARGWLGAAGGLWSTPSDLARWDLALASGDLLGREAMRAFAAPTSLASGATVNYGAGVDVATRGSALVLAHEGAVSGFGASNTLRPSTRSAVVVLVNSERYGAMARIADALVAAVMPRPDVPAVKGLRAAAAARALLRQLQAGALDRAGLSEAFGAYLTPERLRGAAERLSPWGEPTDVKVLNLRERGGLEVSTLELTFEAGVLEASMYRRPDGTVEQFLVDRP
jgi:CubicO group peptidase (beta-lactamase class C family)